VTLPALIYPALYASKTFELCHAQRRGRTHSKERYGCFPKNQSKVTTTARLFTTTQPTPQAQLADKDQYLENVLPHHYVIMGMALAEFELITFEHDLKRSVATWVCGPAAHCARREMAFNRWPAHYHVVPSSDGRPMS
jgi:hypothetical protein